MMMSSTSAFTMAPNAAPSTTATARSTTLPFSANALNSPRSDMTIGGHARPARSHQQGDDLGCGAVGALHAADQHRAAGSQHARGRNPDVGGGAAVVAFQLEGEWRRGAGLRGRHPDLQLVGGGSDACV